MKYYLFGTELKEELTYKLKEIDKNINEIWPDGKDERKLIETIWKLLLHSNLKLTVYLQGSYL